MLIQLTEGAQGVITILRSTFQLKTTLKLQNIVCPTLVDVWQNYSEILIIKSPFY